jgi:hypothetical protein
MRAGGDLAHVPDHRTLRVEIGGADQQDTAAAILGGDAIEQRAGDILGDQLAQRRGVGKRLGAEQARQNLRRRQIAGVVLGPDLAQTRSYADPGTQTAHQRAALTPVTTSNFGPIAALGPAGQQARAERAVAGAARQRQIFDDRPLPNRCATPPCAWRRHVRLHES